MKNVRYSKDEDIMTIELARGAIDHAREVDQFIIHFSQKGIPLLLEIQDASKLLDVLEKVVHGKSFTEQQRALKHRTRELDALNQLIQSYLNAQTGKEDASHREYSQLLKRLLELSTPRKDSVSSPTS